MGTFKALYRNDGDDLGLHFHLWEGQAGDLEQGPCGLLFQHFFACMSPHMLSLSAFAKYLG